MQMAAIFDLVQSDVGPFDSPTPKTLWQFEISMMTAGRHLKFDPTGSSAIRSVDLEKPILEPNMKWIG